MNQIIILSATVVATLTGDYFIKISSQNSDGLFSRQFLYGAFLYFTSAIGWYFLMKSNSLAQIGVIFSASTVIFLAVLGLLVFKELLGWRDILGIVLAIMAVAVISCK